MQKIIPSEYHRTVRALEALLRLTYPEVRGHGRYNAFGPPKYALTLRDQVIASGDDKLAVYREALEHMKALDRLRGTHASVR